MKILYHLTLISILLLTGCLNKTVFVESVSYAPVVQPTNYKSNGALTLVYDSQKIKIRFKWRRLPERYSIGFYGPLGIKLKSISGHFEEVFATPVLHGFQVAPTADSAKPQSDDITVVIANEQPQTQPVIDQNVVDAMRTASYSFRGSNLSLPKLLDMLVVANPKINEPITTQIGEFFIKEILYWKHAGVQRGVLPRSIELQGVTSGQPISLTIRFSSHRITA